VINSNFGRILHRFRDIAAQRTKNRIFALPTLGPPLRGTPSEFLDETYTAETRGMGLLYGENCIILTSNAFDWSTHVTDRQTDGISMAYTCYSIYAVVHKNAKNFVHTLENFNVWPLHFTLVLQLNTHTVVLQLIWIWSGTTQVSRYQKGKTRKVKPIWIYWARDSEWQWHLLDHMQICTSPQTDNHTNNPPLSFYRPDAFLPPNQQRQSTEGKYTPALSKVRFSYASDTTLCQTLQISYWVN